jgi:class 3 adenylate cyclase
VIEEGNNPAAWRSGARGSILGRMRRTEHAPQESGRIGVREEGRITPPAAAEEIRTFLIADVRGYSIFTQERGDEAAGRLAARFADIVREQVQARDGSVIELRGDEALAVFHSPRQAIRTAVELQARLLQETLATPDLPLPVGSFARTTTDRVVSTAGRQGKAVELDATVWRQDLNVALATLAREEDVRWFSIGPTPTMSSSWSSSRSAWQPPPVPASNETESWTTDRSTSAIRGRARSMRKHGSSTKRDSGACGRCSRPGFRARLCTSWRGLE